MRLPRGSAAALAAALAGALMGALLTGCGSQAEPTSAEPTSAGPAGNPAASGGSGDTRRPTKDDRGLREDPPAEVPETLDFAATTVTGEPFEGASLAGKPTLLWFWAPWCPTCRGQIPQVEGLAAEFGDDVNVIGIGSLDSAEAIAGFAGDVDDLTHLEDEEGELWQRFGVTEQSSFVLLAADGSVAYEAGYGDSEELGSRVADLL